MNPDLIADLIQENSGNDLSGLIKMLNNSQFAGLGMPQKLEVIKAYANKIQHFPEVSVGTQDVSNLSRQAIGGTLKGLAGSLGPISLFHYVVARQAGATPREAIHSIAKVVTPIAATVGAFTGGAALVSGYAELATDKAKRKLATKYLRDLKSAKTDAEKDRQALKVLLLSDKFKLRDNAKTSLINDTRGQANSVNKMLIDQSFKRIFD